MFGLSTDSEEFVFSASECMEPESISPPKGDPESSSAGTAIESESEGA